MTHDLTRRQRSTAGSRPLRVVCAVALLATAASVAQATGGAYPLTAHGDPETGVLRVAGAPRGDCAQCHVQHGASTEVEIPGPHPYLLFAPNDNQLCSGGGGTFGCHSTSTPLGIFGGLELYDASTHRTAATMVWPGPDPAARPPGDAGYCVNCHTPHGRADAQGVIPALSHRREQAACLTCHDGSGPALTDVAFDVSKISRHPMSEIDGRHRAGEAGDPSAFGPGNRHAECVDCHNPHDVRGGTRALAPTASNRNRRVSRVSVSNGPAGTRPVYTFRGADDPTSALEYELCFKCHSAWSGQPAGQPDLSLLLNPANTSFHPVEAPGRNPGIRAEAFVAPWTPNRLTYCGDCHGSDDGRVGGVHGSIHDGLLRARYPASPAEREVTEDELCFDCHRYETYADEGAPVSARGLSRWNAPAFEDGHTEHSEHGVPCYSCHDSHGAPDLPFLLVLGRTPGLRTYLQTFDGGTCVSTCHASETYTVNYPR